MRIFLSHRYNDCSQFNAFTSNLKEAPFVISSCTRLRTKCVLNTEWRTRWIVQRDSMVIVWIHRL